MINIKNLERVLSYILSERHDVKINVTLKKGGKENENKNTGRRQSCMS